MSFLFTFYCKTCQSLQGGYERTGLPSTRLAFIYLPEQGARVLL